MTHKYIERLHIRRYTSQKKYPAYFRAAKAPGMDSQPQLSDVFYKLESKSKQRYLDKIALINNEDPFKIKKADFSLENSLLPSLRFMFNVVLTAVFLLFTFS